MFCKIYTINFFLALILALMLFAPIVSEAQSNDAAVEYRNGNYETAAALCKNKISAGDANLDTYVTLCWSLLQLGRFSEAAPYAELASKINQYDMRVLEINGEVNYYNGRNAAALRNFMDYINASPEGGRIDSVYYFIGEIYIRLGRYRHADIAISTALHYTPGNALWWTRAAYAREMSGETREAEKAYRRALELDQNLRDARCGFERTRAALRGGAR